MARLGLLLELLEQRGVSYYAGEKMDHDLNLKFEIYILF